MSEWSSPSNCSQIFKQRSTTPFSQSHHQRSPFASSDNPFEIDECCSAFSTKLSFTPAHHESTSRKSRSPFASADPAHTGPFSSSVHHRPTPIMTIGHFGHSRHSNSSHHQNQHHHHHYGYHAHHDSYHDDSQMLPRIDFPAGQFDRLLRGPSPNNNNNNNSHSRHYSHNHYSSSGNSPGSDRGGNGHTDHGASWKTGPFDSRKK